MAYEKIVRCEEERRLLDVDFSNSAVRNSDEEELNADIGEPGVYVFQAKTSDFAPVGGTFVRFVKIFVTLQVPEREEDVIVLRDQLSSMYNKVALRFHVVSTAKVQVHMSTRARVVPIKLQCRIVKKVALTPSLHWINMAGQDDIDSSDLEKKAFKMEELPSYKRERVYVSCDEWPEKSTYSLTNLPVANYEAILKRDSEEKRKAHAVGLIRPFLLFASMHPMERLRWAKALKVPILDLRRYGDAHVEAFLMIDCDRKGLQARANHAMRESVNPLGNNTNWCQILYRVYSRAMKSSEHVTDGTKVTMKEAKKLNHHGESRQVCLDPERHEDVHLENVFMQGLSEAMQTALCTSDPVMYNKMQIGMNSAKYDDVVQRLLKHGYEHEPTIRCFCWVAERGGASFFFKVIGKWAKHVREGTLRNKARIAVPACTIAASIGLFFLMHITPFFIAVPITLLSVGTASFVWRETPGKLLLPLIGIVCQRFRLALADLNVGDYCVIAGMPGRGSGPYMSTALQK